MKKAYKTYGTQLQKTLSSIWEFPKKKKSKGKLYLKQ